MSKEYDFLVEYAKSGRSQCKTSKELIEKGEIRIGQMVQAPNVDKKIPMWHHWKWFFSKGNKGLTKWEMLYGRENLRLDDQEKIKKLIEKHSGDGGGRGGKRKTTATATADDQSSKKQKFEETDEQRRLREENEALWKVKDNLRSIRPKYLKEILELNNQSSRGGEDVLINRIADGMLFGALPEGCGQDDCKGGHLFLDKTIGKYRCTGDSSVWSKCMWEGDPDTIQVTPWKIPDWLADEYDFFRNWRFERRNRVIVKNEVIRAEGKENEEVGVKSEETIRKERSSRKFFNVGKSMDKPLQNCVIALDVAKNKVDRYVEMIEELGGTYSDKVTPKVTHLISTDSNYDNESAKVEKAIKLDIPVLAESWIKETKSKNVFLNQADYLIGGSEYAVETLERDFTDPKVDDKVDVDEKNQEKKLKLVMKPQFGRSAVDPEAGEQYVEDYHILDLGGTEIYNVVLNLTDIEKNLNSYYGLQVLQHDKKPKSKFAVFRKWGRVATKVGGKKIEEFYSQSDAIEEFKKLYYDKTGNSWKNRDKFQKKPGKFFPIAVEYTDDDPGIKLKGLGDDRKSRLDARIQRLVSLIFNLEIMEESLAAMEVDLKKMPLGKLSKDHIQKGYNVLNEIDAVLKEDGPKKASDLLRLTNQFYTLIPHDFGTKKPPLISDQAMLDQKIKLMESLLNIEIAASLLKEGGDSVVESPIDSNYAKLHTDLIPLNENDEEFKMVQTYMTNQRGSFKLKLLDAFKVAREGEDERFQTKAHLGNRQLLWHGSRVTNYCGILSQGLRIAPPEAPKSGYRFGKGIYFADICEKSAHYCRGGGAKDTILMMLVEVALGKMKELHDDMYMEQPLPGSDSTKALGAVAPAGTMTTSDGLLVPYGKIGNTGIKSSCTHNEYIVYNVSQACIRYLLKIELE